MIIDRRIIAQRCLTVDRETPLAVVSERIVGAPVRREAPENFLVVPHHFLSAPLSGGAHDTVRECTPSPSYA